MSKWLKIENFEKEIKLCNDKEFIINLKKYLSPRFYKILCLRHGVDGKKLTFNEMVMFVEPLSCKGKLLSSRHIAKLYYQALNKIKYILKNEPNRL